MNSLPSKPELPYRYEFQPHELNEIDACNEGHGFAIVKGVIDDATVETFRTAVKDVLNPAEDLEPGEYVPGKAASGMRSLRKPARFFCCCRMKNSWRSAGR